MGTVTYVTHDGDEYKIEARSGLSIMQLATSQGVPGIEAECGGSLSCATCHVYVDENWFESVGAPGQNESDMLDFAEEPGPMSRLSCQIKYSDDLDGLIVRIPESQ